MARHWGAENYARPNARSKKVKARKKTHTVFDLNKLEKAVEKSSLITAADTAHGVIVMYQTAPNMRPRDGVNEGGRKFYLAAWNYLKDSAEEFEDDTKVNLFDDGNYDQISGQRPTRNNDKHPWIAERGLVPEGGGLTFHLQIDEKTEIDITMKATYGTHINDTPGGMSSSQTIPSLPEALFRIRAGINGKAFTKKRWQVLLPAMLMELGFRQDWIETIWSNLRIEGNPGCIAHNHARSIYGDEIPNVGVNKAGDHITCAHFQYHKKGWPDDHHIAPKHNNKFEKSIDPACTEEVQNAIIEFIHQCRDMPTQDYNKIGLAVEKAFSQGKHRDFESAIRFAKDDDNDYYSKIEPLLDELQEALDSGLSVIWEDEIKDEFIKRRVAAKKYRDEQLAAKPEYLAKLTTQNDIINEYDTEMKAKIAAIEEEYSAYTKPHRDKRMALQTANASLLEKASEEIKALNTTLKELRDKYPKRRRRT
jgi:hypothetical protein